MTIRKRAEASRSSERIRSDSGHICASAAPSAGPNVNAIARSKRPPLPSSSRCSSSRAHIRRDRKRQLHIPLTQPPNNAAREKSPEIRGRAPQSAHGGDIAHHGLHSSAVLLPYLIAQSVPMTGEATAWQREKSEPRAPPRRTMS